VFPNEFDNRPRSYIGRSAKGLSTVETICLGGVGSIQSQSGSQSNCHTVDTGTTVGEEFGRTNDENLRE
jgi:hypothetical protein